MHHLVWSDSYTVHDRDLDEQHMILFELIASIAEMTRDDFSDNLYRDLVTDLARYTRSHFRAEELHMAVNGYPHLDRHRQLHRHFIQYVDSLAGSIGNAGYEDMADIARFLENWITRHILIEDRKYVDRAA